MNRLIVISIALLLLFSSLVSTHPEGKRNEVPLDIKSKIHILTAQVLPSKERIFSRGAVDGNMYRDDMVEKRSYIMGVIDGLKAGQLINTDEESYWLMDCTHGMTNFQLEAIVDKYLKNHPEKWHYGMNYLIHSSLLKICPKN